MENTTKKYKNYLILLVIFTIISFVLGYFYYSQIRGMKESIDNTYNALINGTQDERREIIDSFNKDIEDSGNSYDADKVKEVLENYQKGEIYVLLDEGKDQEVISTLSMQFLCMFTGYMLFVILLEYLEGKFFTGLNKVLRIILNIVIVIFTLPVMRFIIAAGAIGLPISIAYCVYKLIKGKKEKKDEIPEEDVVEVEGKVDADEALNKKTEE